MLIKLLSRGCAVLELMSCDQISSERKVVFSSTGYWYHISTNESVLYTYGVVFGDWFFIIAGIGNWFTNSLHYSWIRSIMVIFNSKDIMLKRKRNDHIAYILQYFNYIINALSNWVQILFL